MKCCVIFAMVLLAVLIADASAAPPRARQIQRRSSSHRVHLVPKFAMRRFSNEDPSEAEAFVADNDDSQLGVIEVAAPLITDDPALDELDVPVSAIEEFAPQEALHAVPIEVAAEQEAKHEEEAPIPAPKRGKRPASAPLSPHTFFPMHFAKTSGATIAVSNSFSTGKGSAVSHSIAYGGGKPIHDV